MRKDLLLAESEEREVSYHGPQRRYLIRRSVFTSNIRSTFDVPVPKLQVRGYFNKKALDS